MVYTAYPRPFGNGFSSTFTVNLDYLPNTGGEWSANVRQDR